MRSIFLNKLLDYLKQDNHLSKNTDINLENIPKSFINLTASVGELMPHILLANTDTRLKLVRDQETKDSEFTTDNKVIDISSKLLGDLNEIVDTVYDSVVTLVEDIDSLYKYRTVASETTFISEFQVVSSTEKVISVAPDEE